MLPLREGAGDGRALSGSGDHGEAYHLNFHQADATGDYISILLNASGWSCVYWSLFTKQ
jgi:hypothetical protein